MKNISGGWNSRQVLNMIDNNLANGSKTEIYNTNLIIQKDINEEYPLINDPYRSRIQLKLGGRTSSLAPVFSGGDVKEKFLLPKLESERVKISK